MTSPVVVSRQGEVGHIEFARPQVLNALDEATNLALRDAVRELELDGVKILVISGKGRAFCAGADLKHMRTLSGAPLRRFIELTWEPLEALVHSPIISIAALHGHVLGGGAELALACDLRVASADLSFGFPEMTLGSLPGSGGMQRLPEMVGRAKALELVTLGTRIDAETALALGLLNAIADEGVSAQDFAKALAERIAERPAESLRYAKIAMRMAGRPDLAAPFHGLVSSVRQADPSYQDRTSRFEGVAATEERV